MPYPSRPAGAGLGTSSASANSAVKKGGDARIADDGDFRVPRCRESRRGRQSREYGEDLGRADAGLAPAGLNSRGEEPDRQPHEPCKRHVSEIVDGRRRLIMVRECPERHDAKPYGHQ
jgi:hypothetical protein